ncbi:MAG TPA: family 78 glycoside hydrolase catalytic domain [Bryobacteraceae bacterium]|jgi:alpha-L-rhamnosidase
MSKKILVALSLFSSFAGARPVHLRTEHLENPLGIDVEAPRFSWRADNTERNWRQSAYQIVVATSPAKLKSPDVWDSGKQASEESTGIVYAGPAMASATRYYWSVKTWDAEDTPQSASGPAWFETGLLTAKDWQSAQWIRWQNPDDAPDHAQIHWIWTPAGDALAVPPHTKIHFKTTITLARMPSNAAIFATARGDYKIKVNGAAAGGKNAWGLFDRQEIAGLLKPGANVVEIDMTVPPRPDFGPEAGDPKSPRAAAFAALIKLTYADGSVERIPTSTGGHWEAKLDTAPDWRPAAEVGTLDDKRFGSDPGPFPQPAALLRREFTAAKGKRIKSARAYLTALGSYRFFLNGTRVGNDDLTPDFVDYAKRVPYQSYDVTGLITYGAVNVAAAILGDGWFASGMSWNGQHFSLLPPTRFHALIAIEYEDGSRDAIVTDTKWKASQSAILHSEIYWGEVYDARLEQQGWNATKFDDSKWANAVQAEGTPGVISAQMTAPARIVMRLRPVSVKEQSPGVHIFDMGQNMVGWVALSATGKAGTTVRMRFAEILNPDGSIYRENLRNADATDYFTLRGTGSIETFRPTFTFHGFRYVEVTGYPGKPRLADVTGEVVSSLSGEPTGRLTTSSELVNRMWKIGIWGQRGNFVTVPTDCPQRDERLGWTGDAGAFWRTGSYNFDIASFTHKWMADMRDAQTNAGAFPNVAPDIGLGVEVEGAPGWGDAGVIVPWTAWQQYGDTSYIDRNWAAMNKWMKFIEEGNPDWLRRKRVGPNFADWLAVNSETPSDLIGTAYWALLARMMSQMATAIHHDSEAAEYDVEFGKLRDAFEHEFVKSSGSHIGSGSQTSQLLPLYVNLLDPKQRPAALDTLVKDIQAHGGHLTTGFLGTPFLLFTLAQNGRPDVAYKLLLNQTYPSWGYMLSKGATTWWERWNGDSGDPAMNSFNHYAFGSVVAWVYRSVAGIDNGAPGFKEIVIRPRHDAFMKSARGEYDSIYGTIVSDWVVTPTNGYVHRVTIPANTSAKVYLPAKADAHVTEGGKPVESTPGPDGTVIVSIGSGTYEFRVK